MCLYTGVSKLVLLIVASRAILVIASVVLVSQHWLFLVIVIVCLVSSLSCNLYSYGYYNYKLVRSSLISIKLLKPVEALVLLMVYWKYSTAGVCQSLIQHTALNHVVWASLPQPHAIFPIQCSHWLFN